MRIAVALAAAVAPLGLTVAPATAQPAAQPAFDDRLVLDTGRPLPVPPDPQGIAFTIHGEYQLRFRSMTDLPLEPPVLDPTASTLGQTKYLYHWLRLSPRFQYRDKVAIVGQIDVPRGLVVGDTTRYVDQVRDALNEERFYGVHPRYLYLELAFPIGLLRLGQQGSHWAMGLLANDGDHPTLFGDVQRGSLSERLLFVTTPMGKGTPLVLALAGDLVFEDNTADLLGDDLPERPGEPASGDRAYQGVLAILWRKPAFELGVYGVLRNQERDRLATGELTPFTEELTAGVIDGAMKFNAPVPGADAYVYGQAEGALVFGSTTFLRSSTTTAIDPTADRDPEQIQSYGGALTLGAVHTGGRGDDRWGKVVTEVELGYASGDADPYDGTTRRFTFDPNHNVGLVLFDQVLAWKTARAATLAQDPRIVARPAPGLQFLPSKGGIFGAAYVNPRGIYRPARWLDLKAGVVIAQTTADVTDPYHAGVLGNIANYDGGDERGHDLGVELDLGADARARMDSGVVIQTGVEGGVLLPGNAFDDAQGNRLPAQLLLNTKLGLAY